jgi:anti-sigma B factor antagonist
VDLRAAVDRDGPHVVVSTAGEIDLWSADLLREALHDADQPNPEILVVDLREATFLDSTGLGVLAGALRRQRERGNYLALVVSQGSISKVLAITGMDRVFPIFDSPEDAWKSLSEGQPSGAPNGQQSDSA